MLYRSGMKVVFLHQAGSGVVEGILSNGRVSVLDGDGFAHSYLPSQIAPVYNEEYRIEDDEAENIYIQDNRLNKRLHHKSSSDINKNKFVPEIDLHIEELTDSHRGLSNHEILSQQMIAFRQFFTRSKANKTRKIVAIHGVGEGVLRYEIRSFLNKENGVEYYDASYEEYGQGATVIELWGS